MASSVAETVLADLESRPATSAIRSGKRLAPTNSSPRSIRSGRGQMPPFDLPDSTITGLIKLVRLLNTARVRGDGDAGAESDAESAPVDGGGHDD